ncbi:hypothetical protein [Vibrio sp. HN007]|uniref:hypothetical protein n=1 Tax=Vibrio iocasae TaxID=3098914 RepID=UPI0035D480A5
MCEFYDLPPVIDGFSPEHRYLWIALCFDAAKKNKDGISVVGDVGIDVSIDHLKEMFGATPKTTAEVLSCFEREGLAVVWRREDTKKKVLSITSEYMQKIQSAMSSRVDEQIEYLFSPKVRESLSEVSHTEKVKLRSSNLLLMAIFLSHSNSVGFVDGLTNQKMRMLMGGITESRLKSQIDTLRKISFIDVVGKGGVLSIYFGKFSRRYFITLNLFIDSDSGVVNENRGVSAYDVPPPFSGHKYQGRLSFGYDFDFDFPFKIVHFIRALYDVATFQEKVVVDGFALSRLEYAPFVNEKHAYQAITTKIEQLASCVLKEEWDELKRIISSPDQAEEFKKVRNNIWEKISDREMVGYSSVFTDKHLAELTREFDVSEEAEVTKKHDVAIKVKESLNPVRCFIGRMLLSLSMNLAISIQRVMAKNCLIDNGLKEVSIILSNFIPYTLKADFSQLSSCDVSIRIADKNRIYDMEMAVLTPEEKMRIFKGDDDEEKQVLRIESYLSLEEYLAHLKTPITIEYRYAIRSFLAS